MNFIDFGEELILVTRLCWSLACGIRYPCLHYVSYHRLAMFIIFILTALCLQVILNCNRAKCRLPWSLAAQAQAERMLGDAKPLRLEIKSLQAAVGECSPRISYIINWYLIPFALTSLTRQPPLYKWSTMAGKGRLSGIFRPFWLIWLSVQCNSLSLSSPILIY